MEWLKYSGPYNFCTILKGENESKYLSFCIVKYLFVLDLLEKVENSDKLALCKKGE